MSTPFHASSPQRPSGRFLPNPNSRFLDQCREVLRYKQMALRTEERRRGSRPGSERIGHKDVATTQIYAHAMNKPGLGVKSPPDAG